MFTRKHIVVPKEDEAKPQYQLHTAARHGYAQEVRKLLATGNFDVTQQDFAGKTALHYAASYGHQDVSLEIVNMLLSRERTAASKQHLVNIQDNNGETCLAIAAKNEHRRVVQAIIFAGADVNKKSKQGVEPIEVIFAKVPQAMNAVFDTAVKLESGDIFEENYDVLIDFGPIIGYPSEDDSDEATLVQSYLLFYALKSSEKKCKEVLIHPLVKMFLYVKWSKVRSLFYAAMSFHVAWLALYTFFTLELFRQHCPFAAGSNETEEGVVLADDLTMICPNSGLLTISAILTTAFSICVFLKEAYQILNAPTLWYYIRRLENLGQLLLLVNVVLTTYPTFVGIVQGSIHLKTWQYEIAAFGIFLAWVLILAQIGKTPRLGLYIEILLRVLRSFYLFVVTFISLLVAFALSFGILMPQNKGFGYWPLALSKVLVMMTGELNYDEIFYNDGNPIPFFGASHVLFICFVVVVSIILFNLLIGLTVSDIHGLQAGANVSLLKVQLEQIYFMESFLFSRTFRWIAKSCNCYRKLFSYFEISSNPEKLDVILSIKEIPEEWRPEIKQLIIQNLYGPQQQHPNQKQEGYNPSSNDHNSAFYESMKSEISQIVKEVLSHELRIMSSNSNSKLSPTGGDETG